jgi:hypothetical protein
MPPAQADTTAAAPPPPLPAACCEILRWQAPRHAETSRLPAPQPKDDKKKDGKKEGRGAPDKAQRARTFLEAEFDDAVNALKQQARERFFVHSSTAHMIRLQQMPRRCCECSQAAGATPG